MRKRESHFYFIGPSVSHVQYRLTENGRGTRLTLTHRAFGEITLEHRDGVQMGWEHMLAGMKARAAGNK